MDHARRGSRRRRDPCSVSEEAVPPLLAVPSGGHCCESGAAFFSWPTSIKVSDTAEERANYFANLHKGVLPDYLSRLPEGKHATSFLELMTIRAFHSRNLRSSSLGTAVGFRIRKGLQTDIPAILVFVSKKVNRRWLNQMQCLPTVVEGPGGIWCDVDVIEISHIGPQAPPATEHFYSDVADQLRGGDAFVGPGSQVATQDNYGTLGAIVKSLNGYRQVGFLTNRHVAVDLECPHQKLFHPMPPSAGPSVYLGSVERATSYTSDDLWYGVFAAIEPETFVRADGAFVPFSDDFDMSAVRVFLRGVGEIGDVKLIELQSHINTLIGKKVMKTGSSSGMTTGTVLAYAVEYNDEKGISFFNDILVVGENGKPFDIEGDSGSLIVMKGENGENPRPIAIIWGGTACRSRIKMRVGDHPVNWTSAVDLGRLLNLLELSLVTTTDALDAAIKEQVVTFAAAIGATGDSSTIDGVPPNEIQEEKEEPANDSLDINAPLTDPDIQDDGDKIHHVSIEELQFIPSFGGQPPLHPPEKTVPESLAGLRSEDAEDTQVSLHLGDMESKRRRSDASSNKG